MNKEFCYSTDEEFFNYIEFGDLLDQIQSDTDMPLGATYWRGEKQELTYAECINVDYFLEECDERACEEIGEIYDNCFADVSDDAKKELNNLILAWAEKHVNIRFWKVVNVQELKITEEDLK